MTGSKAFVAKSFSPADSTKVSPIEQFLDAYRQKGLVWETAEPAEPQSLSNSNSLSR